MVRSKSSTSRRQPQTPQPTTPCSVKAIKSWLVPSYWEFVLPYIESAVEHANGELTADDIYQDLLNEKMFLFVANRPTVVGAATCEVAQYPRKTAIRVVTVGGKDFEWAKQLHDALLEWKERINADGIEAYVRKGLVPQLEALGYAQTYIGVWYGEKNIQSDG